MFCWLTGHEWGGAGWDATGNWFYCRKCNKRIHLDESRNSIQDRYDRYYKKYPWTHPSVATYSTFFPDDPEFSAPRPPKGGILNG